MKGENVDSRVPKNLGYFGELAGKIYQDYGYMLAHWCIHFWRIYFCRIHFSPQWFLKSQRQTAAPGQTETRAFRASLHYCSARRD
jgi:hypothetical protein